MEKVDFQGILSCALLCKSGYNDWNIKVSWEEVFKAIYGNNWEKWEFDEKSKQSMASKWWQRVAKEKQSIEEQQNNKTQINTLSKKEALLKSLNSTDTKESTFPFELFLQESNVPKENVGNEIDLPYKVRQKNGFAKHFAKQIEIDSMRIGNDFVLYVKEVYLFLFFVEQLMNLYEKEQSSIFLPKNEKIKVMPVAQKDVCPPQTQKQAMYLNLLKTVYDNENFDGNNLLHKLCAINPLLLAVCGLEDVYERALNWILPKIDDGQLLECNNYNLNPIELSIRAYNGICLGKLMKFMPKSALTKESSTPDSVYSNRLVSLLTVGCIEYHRALSGELFIISDNCVLKQKIIENFSLCAKNWIREVPLSALKETAPKEDGVNLNIKDCVSYADKDIEYDGNDVRVSWLLKLGVQSSVFFSGKTKNVFDEVLSWIGILEEKNGLKSWKIEPVRIDKRKDILGSVIKVTTLRRQKASNANIGIVKSNFLKNKSDICAYGVDLNEFVEKVEKESQMQKLRFNNLATVAAYLELPNFFTSVLLERLKSLTEKEKLSKLINETKPKVEKLKSL